MQKFWRHYKYKNLTLVYLGIILAASFYQIDAFHQFLLHLGNYGYLGAILAGMLFVSTFTVATGAIILLILAEQLHPLEIGLFAGLGAVVGDLMMFHLVKDGLAAELERVYDLVDSRHHLIKVLHTRHFRWTLPVIGALIIASPLPDELGVTLMGISKMKTIEFIPISFLLNSVGIFLIISASLIIKP